MIIKTKIMYECPYCSEKYDDEWDAEECAKECVQPDYVEEVEEQVCICETCNKEYKKSYEASNCEDKHKDKQDFAYQNMLAEKSREKLLESAKHHEQISLLEVKG